MNREELIAKYGLPTRRRDRVNGTILVFQHETLEAAQAYVDANEENYDHPGWIEEENGRFLSLVDLRPAIAEIEKNFKDGIV